MSEQRLFVCYVPGLDWRRVEQGWLPRFSEWSRRFSVVTMRGRTIGEQWTQSLTPVFLTGADAGHFWHVRLKAEITGPAPDALLAKLPQALTTTGQCVWRLFDPTYDLAGVPFKHRKRLEIKRFVRGEKTLAVLSELKGTETVMSVVSPHRCGFHLLSDLRGWGSQPEHLVRDDKLLYLLEVTALDTLQHWFLDDEERVRAGYRTIDDLIHQLHEECRSAGVGMLLLSDHGMERVRGRIDLNRVLRDLSVSEREYTRFVEVAKASFWFHTDAARREILAAAKKLEHVAPLLGEDRACLGLELDDPRNPELCLVAEPGFAFFPHDFYHPLVNLFVGLSDPQQRSRLRDARHRGYHGYLPHHECERGFFVLADDGRRVDADEMDFLDVAPTVLDWLGYPAPATMSGKSILAREG